MSALSWRMPSSLARVALAAPLALSFVILGCDAGSESVKPGAGGASSSGGSSGSGATPSCDAATGGRLEVKLPTPLPAPTLGVKAIAELKRGINLGNALEAPSDADWRVELTEAHFRVVAEAGLDHVRIPVRFSAHQALEAPYTIDESLFARVDWALDQAEAHGLAAILDLHHFNELISEPAANEARFLSIWQQLSERYSERPATVKYELLNEPNGALDAQWNALFPKALAIVRAREPERAVIIDSASWASARNLASLALDDDPNVVVTFHMYEPILFTHQGASWMPPEYQTTGFGFPGPPCQPVTAAPSAQAVPWVRQWFQNYNQLPAAQNPGAAKAIEDIFAAVDAFVKQSGRAVYLGEFAVLDTAPPGSRERWVRLVREHAEARGIPWSYWDDGGMARAYSPSTGAWIPYLKSALFD